MSDSPNSWSILSEYSKSVIAIASALLALAAVANEKLGATIWSLPWWLLAATAGLTFIALVTGLLVAAQMFRYLYNTENAVVLKAAEKNAAEADATKARKTVLQVSNVSYISLGLALLGVLALALTQQRRSTLSEATDVAVETLVHVKGGPASSIVIDSVAWDQASERYVVAAHRTGASVAFRVVVDPKANQAVSLR